VEEADQIRDAARLLEQRTEMLESALAAVDEAERQRAARVSTAEKRLSVADNTRAEAVERARKEVEQAESEHRTEVAKARARLRETFRVPAQGLEMSRGSLRLGEHFLETPERTLPVAGLNILVGSARDLWTRHRPLMIELIVIHSPDTSAFLTALLMGTAERFVLFKSRIGAVLWRWPPGEDKESRRFLATVEEQAVRAAIALEKRRVVQREAQQALEEILRDRSRIESARAQLALLEGGHEASSDIRRARLELERVERDSRELDSARRRVAELVEELLTPPEPPPALREARIQSSGAGRPGPAAHSGDQGDLR
jgi:hypothetical protein